MRAMLASVGERAVHHLRGRLLLDDGAHDARHLLVCDVVVVVAFKLGRVQKVAVGGAGAGRLGLSSLRSYFLAHTLASACMAFLPHCMLDHA